MALPLNDRKGRFRQQCVIHAFSLPMQEQLAMSTGQRLCQNAKFIDFLRKVYNEVIKMQHGNEISFCHLYFIRIYF